MFLGGGLGQQPPILQTKFCKLVEESPESGWGVATASYLHYLFDVCDKISVIVIMTKQSF